MHDYVEIVRLYIRPTMDVICRDFWNSHPLVIRYPHTTARTMLLSWRSFGCKCLVFKKQKIVNFSPIKRYLVHCTETNSYTYVQIAFLEFNVAPFNFKQNTIEFTLTLICLIIFCSTTPDFGINFSCFYGNITISKWPYFYMLSWIFRVSFGKRFRYFLHINIEKSN